MKKVLEAVLVVAALALCFLAGKRWLAGRTPAPPAPPASRRASEFEHPEEHAPGERMPSAVIGLPKIRVVTPAKQARPSVAVPSPSSSR